MKKLFVISLAFLASFCSRPSQKNMRISGKIDGLRKGTLYLQKMVDTSLVSVDSVEIKGNDSFQMDDYIASPEFYFLSLDKDDGDSLTDKILFFGEEGDIKINTLLRTFGSSAKVEGSENQILWEEYQSIMRKFNRQNLENFEKFTQNQEELSTEERAERLEKANENLLKRKYLFALNFAMNNADKEVAAYIGSYEVSDVIPLFLDSLYNKLSPNVQVSKYGKVFKQQLDSLAR